MAERKIGLRLDSLREPPRDAMRTAAALKMKGVEINVAAGDLTPEAMDRQARKHLLHFLEDLDLEIAALGGDVGYRSEDGGLLELFVERTCEIIDFATDLGVPMVTTSIGTTPEDPEGVGHQAATEALTVVGDHAANRERQVALSAGLGEPKTLRDFLDHLASDGLRVNYDPANMVVGGYDPAGPIELLGEYIAAVRVRDARRYLDGSAEELSLGEGDVPYDDVVDALDGIDFGGYFVIARHPQEDQWDEIERAREFLEKY